MLFGNHIFVRGQNPSYRSYEVAGVTHVSRDEHKLDDIVPKLPPPPVLPTRQNLATHSPVFRAMMEHVRAWMTDGIAPPPSASFDGGGYALLPLPCSTNLPIPGVANIPRDANGNARGGIRLPFLRTTVGNKTVGSPLGAYNGMETQYGCTAGGFPQVAIVTGTFLRNDALIGSYKNHGQYVSGVSKAADHAVGQGWILEEDAEAYASTAAHCVVGKRAPASITIDDLIACHHPPI
jgi:hypothetical protein